MAAMITSGCDFAGPMIANGLGVNYQHNGSDHEIDARVLTRC